MQGAGLAAGGGLTVACTTDVAVLGGKQVTVFSFWRPDASLLLRARWVATPAPGTGGLGCASGVRAAVGGALCWKENHLGAPN